MAFVKLYKNKSYFIRYQTKYRRRRQGKTDYYARKRLITQDKDKYNTPKYRLVGRFTNTRCIAQIVFATIKGDQVFCQASSTEFKKFGLNAGLSSYAAGYATGLLLARRVLKKLKLDGEFKGVEKVTGQDYNVSDHITGDNRPFKCILDVGLRPTTTGNRIFSVLKGAIDGGLNVPHSTKRFPGYTKVEDKVTENHAFHRERIFGGHIDKFMAKLKNTPKFAQQFSKWAETLKANGVDTVAKLFEKIHGEIRKNPDFAKKPEKANPKREHSKFSAKKLTLDERKKRVAKRIEIFTKKELKKKDK